MTGRRAASVLSGVLEAGSYGRLWSGYGDSGSQRPIGVYFCRLRAAGVTRTVRIVISR